MLFFSDMGYSDKNRLASKIRREVTVRILKLKIHMYIGKVGESNNGNYKQFK